jgi:two-component system phosphate regulon sensor histidine kinase PhoR
MKNKKEHHLLKSREAIVVMHNVNERARLEQMKSDFINCATHNLRTPLTTIILMLRLLEGECTPEEHHKYWQVLREEVEREHQLIEDLLEVGQLESGRWQAPLHPVSPLPALNQAIQAIAPQATDKNIQVEVALPEQAIQVMGNPGALQQVFANLLSNAVKFTPSGGSIMIRVQLKESEIWFIIEDNGIGIAQEDMPNLFMRFFRGKNAIENEVPGSGIGLFTIKSIIEYFGGRIQARSEINVGTTFEFSLPIIPLDVAERTINMPMPEQRHGDERRSANRRKNDPSYEEWQCLPDSC